MSGAWRELLARFGIEVDTSQLKKGNQEVDNFSDKMQKMQQLIAGAFVVVGASSFVKKVFEEGNALYTASRRAGVAVEAYQSLTYAGEMLNVSMEKVGVGFKYLQRNLAIAANGGDEMKETFKKLGVSIGEGIPVDSEQAFLQIAESIKNLNDKEMQTAVAMRIFGRAGYDLLPMLKAGSEELKKYYARVKELGGGLKGDVAESIDGLDDQLNDQRLQLFSVRLAILQHLLPALTTLSKTVVSVGQAFLAWNKHGETTRVVITTTLLAIAASALAMGAAFKAAMVSAMKILILAMVLEDIYVWLKGGESLIGDFFGLFGSEGAKAGGQIGDALAFMTSSFNNFVLSAKVGSLTFAQMMISAVMSVVNTFAEAIALIGDMWNAGISKLELPSWMQKTLQIGDTKETTGKTNYEASTEAGQQRQQDLAKGFMDSPVMRELQKEQERMRKQKTEDTAKAKMAADAKRYGGLPEQYDERVPDSLRPKTAGTEQWKLDKQRKAEVDAMSKRFGGSKQDYWTGNEKPTEGMLRELQKAMSQEKDGKKKAAMEEAFYNPTKTSQRQVLPLLGPGTQPERGVDPSIPSMIARPAEATALVPGEKNVSNTKSFTDNSVKTINLTVSKADKAAWDRVGPMAMGSLERKMNRDFEAPTFESED